MLAEVESVAPGVPIHAVSAEANIGMEALKPYLGQGMTVALLGSSGVGKSTLTNALMGELVQAVSGIRHADDRGRHTTTSRQLLILPGGGVIIDTPGLRELQLWAADDGFDAAFADIQELAAQCRFNDCGHTNEPGCAVQQAIRDDRLSLERWVSYGKTRREMKRIERKIAGRERALERQKGRQHPKATRKNGPMD